MTFDEVLGQIQDLLQREKRVSYRGLKRRFDLDDEYLEDLKEELIGAKQVAADEDGRFLVWRGASSIPSSEFQFPSSPQSPAPNTQHPGAERRQLTVMFCDLVGSTALSTQLDPEELREVVRAYQETCAAVVHRYEGHIAQHLGDGLLVYFGYPAAHEDDPQRAVRTGLEIIEALHHLNSHLSRPLQVRIGIHTGLVVIGEVGSSEKREILALGETPNLAARLQGLAEPDTVVISEATYHLVHGLFDCQTLTPQELKGFSTPLTVHRVLRASDAQSRFEVAVTTGLTPLVGREHEMGLLRERWEKAKEGEGQAVLLGGEPGIGKSRLVQELKEQVAKEGATRIEFRCSPYFQNSALYPIIDHLQRLLQFTREDTPATKLGKLQHRLSRYRFPQADTVPLLAALLSLPHPEGSPPITVSPQKQKEKTQAVLVTWLVEEAEQAALCCAWEDLHWADPSTLEVLTLLLDQAPTTRLLVLLTFRPEFTPPWGNRSHLSQLTLSRLGQPHVETIVEKVTRGKVLPSEVVQQIVAKTDGVPLFVEELTKMVLESGLVREEEDRYVGVHGGASIPPLAIPSTLQDSLMARLDRFASVREIAQVGAVLGREFSYELLHAVSSMDEILLHQGLRQLVQAELIYQRGLPPQATYLFKHALIQDTAYQSLLKNKRQQLHEQIAQTLVARFPETGETQPEILAHHYTEASLSAQAVPYWQKAGQRASQRSANVEAISHLTKGLKLLETLPETPERAQQELALQLALGPPLITTKGQGSTEVERMYSRALILCRQIGETPELFPVLFGLRAFYLTRGELQTARELGERGLNLARSIQDPTLLLVAHQGLGAVLFFLGELALARDHVKQAITLYDPQQHNPHISRTPYDAGVVSFSYTARILWFMGYPDQALKQIQEALILARKLSHPFSLIFALGSAVVIHQHRREGLATQKQAEAVLTLSNEQNFAFWGPSATLHRGWALVEQGQEEEGIEQIRKGLAIWQDQGAGGEMERPSFYAVLAEACVQVGRTEEGLSMLVEALAAVDKTGVCYYGAELHRLKGELTLQEANQKSKGKSQKPKIETNPQHPTPSTQVEAEAEACFLKAIEVARHQQAKSLELRAVMSLSRLWQSQGKKKEAHEVLAEIYGWFSEGFDTKDLQEARALLMELGN